MTTLKEIETDAMKRNPEFTRVLMKREHADLLIRAVRQLGVGQPMMVGRRAYYNGKEWVDIDPDVLALLEE
jgi:hypothetical protein